MNVNYRKIRNSKKALIFSISAATLALTALAFSLSTNEKLLFAPLSVFFLVIAADSFYKFYLTDLIYSIKENGGSIIFSVHRTGRKKSGEIFVSALSKSDIVDKYSKNCRKKRGVINLSSELFSKDKYFLTLKGSDNEEYVIITVGNGFAEKLREAIRLSE